MKIYLETSLHGKLMGDIDLLIKSFRILDESCNRGLVFCIYLRKQV